MYPVIFMSYRKKKMKIMTDKNVSYFFSARLILAWVFSWELRFFLGFFFFKKSSFSVFLQNVESVYFLPAYMNPDDLFFSEQDCLNKSSTTSRCCIVRMNLKNEQMRQIIYFGRSISIPGIFIANAHASSCSKETVIQYCWAANFNIQLCIYVEKLYLKLTFFYSSSCNLKYMTMNSVQVSPMRFFFPK